METITHNTDKNGIEISFDYHVTDQTKAWFRSNSFRWSKRSNVWWRPFSEDMWTKVHEYFKQGEFPSIKPNTTCDICGKVVDRRGIGTHKRMAHGIVVKRVMTVINNKGETVERSIRPTAYVPVKTIEQKIEVQPAPEQTIPQPVFEVKKSINPLAPGISVISEESWMLHQRVMKVQFKCKNCGHYCVPDTFPDSKRLNTGCLQGMKHEE